MIKQFNAAEFNEAVQNSDKPLIVDFYADWCTMQDDGSNPFTGGE